MNEIISQLSIDQIYKGMLVKNSAGDVEGKIVSVDIVSDELTIYWSDGCYAGMERERFDEVMIFNKYSDVPLSEVPYGDIFVGMEIISAISTPGKVISKLDVEKIRDPDNANWIEILWNNGKKSYDCHYNFHKVKVK